MSALDAVRWPDVLNELAVELPHLGEETRWAVERSRFLPPLVAALAVLATAAGVPTVTRVVTKHGAGLDGHAIGTWLHWTARMALRCIEKPAPAVVPGSLTTNRLFIDPRIGPLPLLHLAAEYAETSTYPLVIRSVVDLGPICAGYTARAETVPVVESAGAKPVPTVVTLVNLNPRRANVGETWLHELAHVLDERHGFEHCDTDAGELFADTLGALLAKHRPANLAQVAPLIADARKTSAASMASHKAAVPSETSTVELSPTPRRVELPEPGFESLAAFMGLPLRKTATDLSKAIAGSSTRPNLWRVPPQREEARR